MEPDGSEVKCVVIKFVKNEKYLRYMPEGPEEAPSKGRGLFKGIVQGNGDDPTSPCARFYLERPDPSRIPGRLLFHLRCSYNGKYLVARKVEGGVFSKTEVNGGHFIFCGAEEPQEDTYDPSCTLFRLPRSDDSNARYFGAAGGDKQLFVFPDGQPTRKDHLSGCLMVLDEKALELVPDPAVIETYSAFTVITVVDRLVLPKQVCFKGDNGRYLALIEEWEEKHLAEKGTLDYIFGPMHAKFGMAQFSATDIGDPSVIIGVPQYKEDGSIGIMNGRTGRYFWRHSSHLNYVLADSKVIENWNPDFWFRAIKLGGNKIALQHVQTGRFAKRFSAPGYPDDLLAANEETMVEIAQLELVEPVRSRQLYNVKFDMASAKTFHENVVTLTTAHAVNRSSHTNTAKLTLKYTVTKQTTLETSTTNSVTKGVDFSITLPIPKISAQAQFQYHTETTDTRSWGESKTETEEQSVEYEITAPPNTKVTIKLMATEGSFEVPFSYTQKDLLTTGKTVEYRVDNGIYRGVNSYDLTYEVTEESLQPPPSDHKASA